MFLPLACGPLLVAKAATAAAVVVLVVIELELMVVPLVALNISLEISKVENSMQRVGRKTINTEQDIRM